MNFRTIMLNVFSASVEMEKENDKQRMNAPACNPTPWFQPLPFPYLCVCVGLYGIISMLSLPVCLNERARGEE